MFEVDAAYRPRLPRTGNRLRPPPPDPPSDEEIVVRGLDWIEANLDRVDPRSVRRANAAGTPAESPLVEFIVVLRWLHHRKLPAAATAAVQRCLDRVAEIFQQPVVRDRLFRQTAAIQYYIWPVVLLRDCGRLTEPGEFPILQRLVSVDYASLHNTTHSAHALMERRYIFELGGLAHRLPPFARLYPRNVLGAPVDPLFITDFEAYAVTHIVFYLSDMGLRPVSGVTRTQRRQMGAAVRVLLELYLCLGNLDLIAELLVCWRALGLPDGDLAGYARACLLGARLDCGAWPGPFYDSRVVRGRSPEDRDAYLFRACYHTTLVALMAAILTGEEP